MICLKCDICGNAFDFGEKTPNHIDLFIVRHNGCYDGSGMFDICPDCYNAIKKAIDYRRKCGVNPMEDDLK